MNKNLPYEYPSTHHRLIGYPYRVWIFSLTITPLLLVCLGLPTDKGLFASSPFYKTFLLAFFFIITSLPAIVIYMVVFWTLADSKIAIKWIKLLLFLVAISVTGLMSLMAPRILHLEFFPTDDLLIYFTVLFIFSFALRFKEE